MATYHFALSGFSCNGKTSILEVIKGFIPKDYAVFIAEETTRVIDNIHNQLNLDLDQYTLEKCILSSEYILQDSLSRLSNKFDKNLNLVIIYDRSIFDVLTFMVIHNMLNLEQVNNFIKNNISIRYNKLFLIGPILDEDFIYNRCITDELRKKTIDNFLVMQNKFYNIINKILSFTNKEQLGNIIRLEHPFYSNITPLSIISEILDTIKEGE